MKNENRLNKERDVWRVSETRTYGIGYVREASVTKPRVCAGVTGVTRHKDVVRYLIAVCKGQ